MALKNNTWKINQWYDQSVAGNVTYTGAGALFAWGSNQGDSGGALGQNNTTEYSSPVQIPGTTWAQVSARGDTTSVTATKTDGTLWAWGQNNHGQLGQNSRTLYSSPVQVGSDTTWKYDDRFALGGLKVSKFAIKTDGTLWAWGSQSANGVLGLNQYNVSHSSPAQIPGTTWSTVEGGTANYMAGATKTDGTAWVWGTNGYGAMGVNQPTNYRRSSPVQIPGTWDDWAFAGSTVFGIKD